MKSKKRAVYFPIQEVTDPYFTGVYGSWGVNGGQMEKWGVNLI